MKKFLKKFKGILAVGLITALLSTSAQGSGVSGGNGGQTDEAVDGGMYSYCVATGEVTYIPPEDTEAYSDETEGFSPGYNPYADEDNNGEELAQPYYMADNRIKISNPQNDERCRNTVYIEAVTQSGDIISGSGFMIGPNAVATCGHVLCNNGFGEDNNSWAWIKSAQITPAMNTGSNPKPYGSANATYFICGREWAKNLDNEYDWGIIILDSNIGNKVGWLGLQYQSSSYTGDDIRVNGYPKINGSSETLYMCTGTVSKSQSRLLYSKNAYISGGNSGGPCYIYSKETGYTAIGISIHTISSDPNGKYVIETVFRRIDKPVYNELVKYRTSTL